MSDLRTPKVIVVMPARQAAATLEQTFAAIPTDVVDEVILVDDHSTDDTVRLARELPLHLVWHPHQTGYGANQKTCYLEALQRDADVVVMLHPDGQYEPELIPSMIEPIVSGEADLVMGSRLLVPGAALAAGMPRWKYLANRFLTTFENRIMGTNLSEAHTGYRAYSRRLLLTVPFLRNSLDFVLRLRAPDAGVALRLHHQGGAGSLPLLRGRLLGRLSQRGGVRHEDAAGGRPAPPAPYGPVPVAQVRTLRNRQGTPGSGSGRSWRARSPIRTSASWERRRCESRRPSRRARRSTR